MPLTETKIFLISRELLTENELHETAGGYLAHMANNDLKLMHMFEEKMSNDQKFREHVLNKKEIIKNMLILNNLKDENDKYNAIIKIMNKYLHLSK